MIAPLKAVISRSARDHCVYAVFECKGNKSEAARALGIHRNTLEKYLKGGRHAGA